MISTSVTFSPYSSYPSALTRPQAQKGEGAPESQEAPPDIPGEKKTAEPQSAKPDAAKPGAAKQDPAKEAQNQKLIDELKRIDRNVRTHEQAHLAAAGGLAVSGATFGYQRGPDGQQYAVSGEVSIDVSPGRTPQETISKAARIQAAALAPADPSPQDRAVAGNAAQMKLQAQQELAQEKLEAAQGKGSESEPAAKAARKESPPAVAKDHPGIASYRANSAAANASSRQIDYAA